MKAASTACLLLVALLFPLAARAQVSDARAPDPEPVVFLAAGGVFGAVVGTLLGGAAGFAVMNASGCGELPCLGLVTMGAAAGLAAGTPYGVHLANGRRGTYGWALLASLGVSTVGLVLANGTDSPTPLLAIPVGQIVTSILIERGTM